jgi:hypothetical protein
MLGVVPSRESDHRRNLQQAHLKGVGRTNLHTKEEPESVPAQAVDECTHLNAMLPLRAKDIAFMNSVVFGTRANRVTPRNFSSIPEPWRITSTTSTRSSVTRISQP